MPSHIPENIDISGLAGKIYAGGAGPRDLTNPAEPTVVPLIMKLRGKCGRSGVWSEVRGECIGWRDQQKCTDRGGTWDRLTDTCIPLNQKAREARDKAACETTGGMWVPKKLGRAGTRQMSTPAYCRSQVQSGKQGLFSKIQAAIAAQKIREVATKLPAAESTLVPVSSTVAPLIIKPVVLAPSVQAPYVAPVPSAQAPYVAPVPSVQAPYVAPVSSAPTPYIAPVPSVQAPYTAPQAATDVQLVADEKKPEAPKSNTVNYLLAVGGLAVVGGLTYYFMTRK